MFIAPNFTANQWKNLKLEQNEQDWQKAIDIFKSRIESRYIDPVEKLLEIEDELKPSERRFGFTILAINLLLMETIQAFKDGLETTDGQSKKVFKDFLKSSPHFSPYFTTDSQRETFYKAFRCGILHQGEIQSSALVWSIGELYERAEGMETLNRNAVHKAIKSDLEDYINGLRNPASKSLRVKFRKKMDFLANRQEQVVN